MVESRKFIICWAAAWLNDKHKIKGKVMSDVIRPNEIKKQNDKRICQSLADLIEESDVVVGHNSDAFDLKTLNWRLLFHGIPFPPKVKKLDTFKLYGRETKPESRGLEYLSLSLGGKEKNGLDLLEWVEIVDKGTPRLLKKADVYCRGDVREGVNVFKKFADAYEMNGGELYK